MLWKRNPVYKVNVLDKNAAKIQYSNVNKWLPLSSFQRCCFDLIMMLTIFMGEFCQSMKETLEFKFFLFSLLFPFLSIFSFCCQSSGSNLESFLKYAFWILLTICTVCIIFL
jgi:hypothetical protein